MCTYQRFLLGVLSSIIGIVSSTDVTHYCENNGEPVVISGMDSGVIKTLVKGTSHYGHNMNCRWIIKAGRTPYKRIHLSVKESDMQWTPSDAICIGKDNIDVRDGEFADSARLATWCGEVNPHSLISSGSSLYITFSTDDRQIYNERGVTLEFTLFGEGECPSGYFTNSSNNDYCYSFKTSKETWASAQQLCNKDQANLVSFEDANEAAYITGKAKTELLPLGFDKVWIGLHDLGTEGTYQWIDEVKSSVKLNWYALPHVDEVYKDCILLRTRDGFWQEEFCTEDEVQTTKKFPFVCKRKRNGLTELFPLPRANPEKEGKKGTLPPKPLIIGLTVTAVVVVIGIGIVVYIFLFRRERCVCLLRNESTPNEVMSTEEELPPAYGEVVTLTATEP